MFKDWGFLITEMVGLIIIAALLGLFVGWLIWGRRDEVNVSTGNSGAEAEAERLKKALEDCRAAQAEKDARIAALQADIDSAPAATPVATASAALDGGADYDGDGLVEGSDEGSKPTTLSEARDGQPDDLKQIKGIGPKLEKLCNELGFFHFDQIANWTDQEVAWVDANLTGFKGRVSRDNWVSQAKLLADGGETAFSKRVQDGDVY
jgi:predicted flap endonuclease-1-like 5' DNA nuclease